jgi:hypothetical protein
MKTTNETQHTPGNSWVAVKNKKDADWHVAPAHAFKDGVRWYADKVCDGVQTEEHARLIASAHALLSELENVADWLAGDAEQEGAAMVDRETVAARLATVRAVIAAARGGRAST